MNFRNLCGLIITLIMFTACSGTTENAAVTSAAKQYFTAYTSGDHSGMMALVCNEKKVLVPADVFAPDTVDISGLTFDVLNRNEDKAELRLNGRIRMKVNGQWQEFPATNIYMESLKMVNEDGWKVCGA